MLIEKAKKTREANWENLHKDSVKYGRITCERQGTALVDVWKGGTEAEEIKRLEGTEKDLTDKVAALRPGRKKLPGAKTQANYLLAQQYTVRIKELKQEITCRRETINKQKWRLIRETRRLNDEKSSAFSDFRVYKNGRYQLLNLIGKGGFSEVYEAFDLKTYKFVACKFNTLNPSWSDAQKSKYICHVERECKILMGSEHDNVVKFIDYFQGDGNKKEEDDNSGNISSDNNSATSNTFCMVIEICSGGDLDMYIKRVKVVPEKEARAIILQVFEGLKYLHTQEEPIIHYDLKPGNILFTADMIVKITDFGLSKIMVDSPSSIELTSQGAGTYWYLPPEAFDSPRISTKLDVWSAGVILFQMVFGVKPFGNNVTQQRFYSEGLYRDTTVVFPPEPKVSQETKDIILRCLVRNPDERSSSEEICDLIYTQNRKK